MRLTHIYCHRRNSEIWSATTALRQRAGERGAWGAAASSTWTSSSSAAVPPALGRMEAAGSKVTYLWLSSFSTIVLCITQNEIVHCGLVMGRLKGRVKNWPFRINGIVQFLLHNYTTNILISVTYYAVQSWVATIHIIKEMFMFCLHFLFHNICKMDKTQNKTKTNTVTQFLVYQQDPDSATHLLRGAAGWVAAQELIIELIFTLVDSNYICTALTHWN